MTRRLTPQERALWTAVRRTVRPIGSSVLFDEKPPDEEPANDAPSPEPLKRAVVAPLPHPAPAYYPPQSRPMTSRSTHAGPLPDIDRKTRRSISGGRFDIDARLDLHGMTQSEAHGRLLRFLAEAKARDRKLVLVITGKGSGRPAHRHPEPERGVLRIVVPLWLEQPEFRRYVLASHASHVSHGGDGALYILIRRHKAG